ncbi:MAG: AraC family transcriptional regulator [Spirochaetes bacterium]|nr:AraC family transcriptional regulator [Spirochaetota bacterium]
MAEVKSGKNLELNNLISIRKRMSQSEINSEILNIGNYLKEKGANKNGPLVTATYKAELVNNEPFLDMEILLPVDKKIEVASGYQFKDSLILNDMLTIQHKGNPNFLPNTYSQLVSYISDNQLEQNSPAYNVYHMNQSAGDSIEDMVIDIYVRVK